MQNAGMGPPGLHEGSSHGSGQSLPGRQVLTGHKAPLMNMGREGSAHPSCLGSGDASLGHKEAALQGTGSGSDPAGTGTHDREEPVLSSSDPWLLPPSISIPHYPPSQPCRPLHLAPSHPVSHPFARQTPMPPPSKWGGTGTSSDSGEGVPGQQGGWRGPWPWVLAPCRRGPRRGNRGVRRRRGGGAEMLEEPAAFPPSP